MLFDKNGPIPSNGQTRTQLREARAEAKLLKTQLEIRALKHKTKLCETVFQRRELREQNFLWDWVSGYQDLLDRLSTEDGRMLTAVSIANDRAYGANWPFWRTWQEHALYRGAARIVCNTNTQAQGALTGLTSFIVGEGLTYKARQIKGKKVPDGMTEAVQRCVDEFHKLNGMAARQKNQFRRDHVDGEFFVRTFEHPKRDGLTLVRAVGPELVGQDPASPMEIGSFGIINPEHDLEGLEGFHIAYDGNFSGGEDVSAIDDDYEGEMLYHKRNVDEVVKRGVSDFVFDTYDQTKISGRLLEAMAEGSTIQASIAMILQHDVATESQAADFADADKDYTVEDPYTARSTPNRRVQPGEVQQIPKGYNYVPPPYSAGLALHTSVAATIMRAVGVRWNAPEWLISGDNSNTSYASSLTAESPFVKTCKSEQQTFGDVWKYLYWVAIRNKARAGLIRHHRTGERFRWDDIRNCIDLDYTAPTVETRDKAQEAQTFSTELQNGVTSRQIWASAIGNDWEQVQQDNEEYQERNGQQGAQLPMPGGEGVPGMPGGEEEPEIGSEQPQSGLMPMPSPLGEGILEQVLQEAGFTGIDKHGHKWVNGKQVKREEPEAKKERKKSKKDWNKADMSGKAKILIAKAAAAWVKTEHKVTSAIEGQVNKLPAPVREPVKAAYRVAMLTYNSASKLVKGVAQSAGLDEKRAGQIAYIVGAADILVAKPAVAALHMMGVGSLGVAAGGLLPVASALYLGYSLAKRPMAVARAASHIVGIVRSSLAGI